MRIALSYFVVVVAAAGCASEPPRIPDKDADDALAAPFSGRFLVHDPERADWKDRSFLLQLPENVDVDDDVGAPLLIVLHGGGGNAESAFSLACPGGNTSDEGCWSQLAEREGFVVVAPEGTPAHFFPNHRTWNAGGGGEQRCTSGRACKENVDDVAFFDALLAEVQRGVRIDARRIFVAGMSNGAAMAHRLACERSTVVAAIGPVGGGNQLQTVQGCNPARPVPVLQLHGTADPCWRFGDDDDMGACERSISAVPHVSIEATIEGWCARNGCDELPAEDAVADDDDDDDDGLSSVRLSFAGCLDGADVELVRTDGGGHTWPRGYPYLGENVIGKTTTDFSANELLWAFFVEHPLP